MTETVLIRGEINMALRTVLIKLNYIARRKTFEPICYVREKRILKAKALHIKLKLIIL